MFLERRINKELNNLVDSIFDTHWIIPSQNHYEKGGFRHNKCQGINLYKLGDKVYVETEMVGFSKNGVEISLEDDILKIYGKSNKEDKAKDIEWTYKGYIPDKEICKEIDVSNIKIDKDSITAKLENGILTVIMSKKEEDKKKKIIIE